jgi:hypothetical protein
MTLRDDSRKAMEAYLKKMKGKKKRTSSKPKRKDEPLSLKAACEAAGCSGSIFTDKEERQAERAMSRLSDRKACSRPLPIVEVCSQEPKKAKKRHPASNCVQVVVVEDECAEFKRNLDDFLQIVEVTKEAAKKGVRKSRAKPKTKKPAKKAKSAKKPAKKAVRPKAKKTKTKTKKVK